jgi:soluble lytic murein transglycosylase-like protein
MTDNMYTVMKRITEIKGRFGLNRHRDAGQAAAQQPRTGYQEHQDRAVRAGKTERPGPVDSDIAGIKGNSVEEIRKLADHYAAKNRVPSALVKAVIEAESNFNPRAVSPKGAKGLMQLMPSVIKDLGVQDPFDPNENIDAGVSMLKDLLREYNGDYTKALSAYNAGRRAVNEKGGMPDYPETREYVKKVINSYVKNSE